MKAALFLFVASSFSLTVIAKSPETFTDGIPADHSVVKFEVRSKIDCTSAKSVAKDFQAFKKTSDRFYSDYDSLDQETRLNVLQQGLNKMNTLNDKLTTAAYSSSDPSPLVDQAQKLSLTLEMDGATPSQMRRPLKEGVPKLEDHMDDLIAQVQTAHPECGLINRSKSVPDSGDGSR